MPKTSEMRTSKYLQQSEVGNGTLLTITGCKQQNVANDDAPAEMKWCLTFAEVTKALVLNAINTKLCEKACGSDDTDDWVGKQIVVFVDPNVSYGGRITGGLRVRAPRRPAAKGLKVREALPPIAAPPPPEPAVEDAGELYEDDIPF